MITLLALIIGIVIGFFLCKMKDIYISLKNQ
jgi:hypothetical protein